MNSRTRRHSWRWCLPLGLALASGSAHAAALDSDHDGLSDEQEIRLGLDPHSVDSNMDGIADGDAYRLASANTRMLLQTPSASPTADTDGDGIRDFLETYGYYDQDHTLVGLKRIVPEAAWNDFASRSPVLGHEVYRIAAQALVTTGRAQLNAAEKSYAVDATDAYAYDSIRNAFISNGVPADSVLITGTTAQPGSIAAIMSFIVTEHDYLVPTDNSGAALPVYFTHPLRVSTDNDPYSDYDEALGTLNAPPAAPADHPLVAALPAIGAQLLQYKLTEISQLSTTLGSSSSHTDVTRNTSSFSHSHGFAVSVKDEIEVGIDPTKFAVKPAVTVTQSNSFSIGTSVATEDRDTHTTFSQRTTAASDNCFAKLGLTVRLDNVGSALASDISARLNVFFGDTLWRSVPVPVSQTLGPNKSGTPFTVLGQPPRRSWRFRFRSVYRRSARCTRSSPRRFGPTIRTSSRLRNSA